MVTKKIGVIGCGNMGGAILYGALESGVLAKENVYVYDINPAMMEKQKAGASILRQMMKMSARTATSFYLQ